MNFVDRGLILALSIALLSSTSNAIELELSNDQPKFDAISFEMVEQLYSASYAKSRIFKTHKKALISYYAEEDFRPVWINENGFNVRAQQVIKEIAGADEWGLNSEDYKIPHLGLFDTMENRSIEKLAEAELFLSFSVLSYTRDAAGGRINTKKLGKFIDVAPELPNPLEVMEKLTKQNNVSENLINYHPRHEQFMLLKNVLKNYRAQSIKSKAVTLPNGRILKLGDKHRNVDLLRKRLSAVSSDQDSMVFDENLQTAVKSFQKRHGLVPDGIVGPSTITRLNLSPQKRIKTVIANMERWRWLPRNLGDRHLMVNIPEFRFRVMNQNQVVHSERVVTGKRTNQTAVFSDEMEFIVFNPNWYPPQSIIRNEIIPGARRNPQYISRNNLLVTNSRGKKINPQLVKWTSSSTRKLSFRQPPGPRNVLGEMKFLFPNKHAIYLHDTPTKSLFKRTVRAYSHGCVRVRNPRKLAELILSDDKGWTKRKIARIIASGSNNRITLTKKFPVHLSYFTAWVDAKSGPKFFSDIYRHDRKVLAALSGKTIPRDPADPKALAERRRIANQTSATSSTQSFFANFFSSD